MFNKGQKQSSALSCDSSYFYFGSCLSLISTCNSAVNRSMILKLLIFRPNDSLSDLRQLKHMHKLKYQ